MRRLISIAASVMMVVTMTAVPVSALEQGGQDEIVPQATEGVQEADEQEPVSAPEQGEQDEIVPQAPEEVQEEDEQEPVSAPEQGGQDEIVPQTTEGVQEAVPEEESGDVVVTEEKRSRQAEKTEATVKSKFNPPTPVLTGAAKYNNKVLLRWKADSKAVAYEIKRNGVFRARRSCPVSSFKDKKLSKGKKYRYRIRAVYKVNGEKVYSDYSNAVTLKAKRRTPVILIVNDKKESGINNQIKRAGMKFVRVYSASKINVNKYDGLILPGGGDVNPKFYGQKKGSRTYGINTKKDKLQMKAIKAFADRGKPILGICRGEQIVNVTFGGTLKQHIGWHRDYRTVKIVKGTWIRSIYGETENPYHSHHQCVKKVAPGFIVAAKARGGYIEAIQHKKLPIYGVQWHPEAQNVKNTHRLFSSFKKKCLNIMAK